jgi:hypothetical protein
MRGLISDTLVMAGVLLSKLGLENGARRLIEAGVKVGLPGLNIRFDWGGVSLAEKVDREKSS